MTNLIEQYNALDGTEATRNDLVELSDKLFNAIGKSAEHEAVFGEPFKKLSKLLDRNADTNLFAITLSNKINTEGLNGAWHTGIKKDALDDCNRLKKGYKYDKGGKIVKVSKVKAKPKKASKKTATTKPEKNNNKTVKLDSDETLFILDDLPKKYEKAIFGSAFAELKRLAEKSSDKTLSTAAKNMLYLLKEDLFVLLNFKKGYERDSDKQEYRNVPAVYTKLLSKDLAKIKDVKVLDFLLRKTREYVYETAWNEYKFNGKDVFEISKILKFNIKSIEKQIEKLNTETEVNPEALGIPFLSKEQQKEFGDDETVGLGKPFGNNDVYQMVTDRIIDAIKDHGDLTWYNGRNDSKEKDNFVNVSRPINYNLNKYYRGINAFILSHYPTVKDTELIEGRMVKIIKLVPITDDRLFWMTFKQIEAAKGKLKKGAKSLEAVYYNFTYKLDGKSITEAKYKKLFKEFGCSSTKINSDNCARLEKNMFLKYYRVFNERDIENVDFEAQRKKKAEKAKTFTTEVEKIDAAEAVINNMPTAPPITEVFIGEGDSPHYSINNDEVIMPLKKQYDDVSIWYGTAFHELVHSTGAAKRLSREGITDFDRFGSPKYSLEELIAELGSAYLNAESGIFLSTLKKNAAYIKGWKKSVVKLLREDNKAIFKAAGQAQKAADYILDRDEKGDPKFYKDLDKKTKPKAKKQSKKDAAQLALFAAAQKKKKNNGLGFAVQPLQPKNYVLISQQDTQEKDGNEFEKGFSNVPPSDAILNNEDTSKPIEKITNVAQAIKAVKKAINPEPKAKVSSIVSTEDLMNMQFDTLDFTGTWANFLENPARNMKIAIWGKPKNGKTVGACQLANYLTNFGKVLYNFADQGINASTQKIWNLTGLSNNNKADLSQARSLKELENICKTGEYSFIFIDMINTYIYRTGLKPHEFEDRFIKAFPDISFILIFEVTKSGNFKGDQAWTHLPDALVTVENYVMNASGRYGVGHHIIWPEQVKKTNPNLYAELTEDLEPEAPPEATEPKGFVIENF